MALMKKVFITGASSGIGLAIAKAYAAQYQRSGITLGLVGRKQDALLQLAEELKIDHNALCVTYSVDVRDRVAFNTAANNFINRFGCPNIVIASAGVSIGTLTEHQEDVAVFQAVIDTNIMGLVHTFNPFIMAMKNISKVQSQLVGISSVAGIRGLPGSGAYSASKAAAITYLESLRVEMKPYSINVTTIAPGYIRTPMKIGRASCRERV